MKRYLCICILLSSLLFLLSGCGAKVGELFEGEVNTYEGVTMSLVEGKIYRGSANIEILNTTDAQISSGNAYDYSLQKEVDGAWYWLEAQGGSANTLEALTYPKDETVEQVLSWTGRYGNLSAGHYRVVKDFFEYRGPGDYTGFLLAAEFTIG